MEILTIENLSFCYPMASKPSLSGASFSLLKGELVLLCGATGSGKSTLLRLMKRELSPRGERTGRILLDGVDTEKLSVSESARSIGFVMQRPEEQIVTDKVWHELAFGLENLGMPPSQIAMRVAEIASFFGIEEWFERDTASLSGGEKQLLNLAAVTAMQPKLLLLDEPTAQLDPIAATSFLEAVRKLNRELSITVLMSEHRLEEAMPICDRLMVMAEGRVTHQDTPARVIANMDDAHPLLCAMPAAARLSRMLGERERIPLTVREGREWLQERQFAFSEQSVPSADTSSPSLALEIRSVFCRYEKNAPDVLRGATLAVREGESFCILGGNGTGKSTLLRVAAGLLSAYSGRVRLFGKDIKKYSAKELYGGTVAMLPQDVQTLFLYNTVREELAELGEAMPALPFDVSAFLDRNPYDLSGGEQQLVALSKVLFREPRLLLLDEPTKGIDALGKRVLARIILELKGRGVTVLTVTHDVEFAALCADRCALFFRGEALAVASMREFFSENNFYTTAISRITRGFCRGAATVEDACLLHAQARKEGSACS